MFAAYTMLEKFKNDIYTLKTLQMFAAYTMLEEFENGIYTLKTHQWEAIIGGEGERLLNFSPIVAFLVYLLVSTRAVIDQFSGPYSCLGHKSKGNKLGP